MRVLVATGKLVRWKSEILLLKDANRVKRNELSTVALPRAASRNVSARLELHPVIVPQGRDGH